MVKRHKLYVGPKFMEMRNILKKESGMSDAKLTDEIARFIDQRNEFPVMMRVAKKRREKGWFFP